MGLLCLLLGSTQDYVPMEFLRQLVAEIRNPCSIQKNASYPTDFLQRNLLYQGIPCIDLLKVSLQRSCPIHFETVAQKFAAQFERELMREHTKAGLKSARARKGGRRFGLTKAQVRLAQSAMGKKETRVSELCAELGITRATLYRYVDADGSLREYGKRVLAPRKEEH